MKIQELLKNETCWTKRVDARNKEEYPVSAFNRYAVKWCLIGALNKCYSGQERFEMLNKLEKVLFSLHCDMSLSSFNDASSTTFKQIREVIEKADV